MPPKATAQDTITIEADLLPHLIAGLGPDAINSSVYKKMVALKATGRKEFWYWKFFKAHKDKANELLAAHPELGKGGASPAPAKEKKAAEPRKRKATMLDDENDEDTTKAGSKKIKEDAKDDEDAGGAEAEAS